MGAGCGTVTLCSTDWCGGGLACESAEYRARPGPGCGQVSRPTSQGFSRCPVSSPSIGMPTLKNPGPWLRPHLLAPPSHSVFLTPNPAPDLPADKASSCDKKDPISHPPSLPAPRVHLHPPALLSAAGRVSGPMAVPGCPQDFCPFPFHLSPSLVDLFYLLVKIQQLPFNQGPQACTSSCRPIFFP